MISETWKPSPGVAYQLIFIWYHYPIILLHRYLISYTSVFNSSSATNIFKLVILSNRRHPWKSWKDHWNILELSLNFVVGIFWSPWENRYTIPSLPSYLSCFRTVHVYFKYGKTSFLPDKDKAITQPQSLDRTAYLFHTFVHLSTLVFLSICILYPLSYLLYTWWVWVP